MRNEYGLCRESFGLFKYYLGALTFARKGRSFRG